MHLDHLKPKGMIMDIKHAWVSPPSLPWHATHSDLELMEDGIPLGQFPPKSHDEIRSRALTPDLWLRQNGYHDNKT